MMRGLWLVLLWVGMGSARADAPRWEDVPLPSPGQALVDTTGTLRPETHEEVNRLAAGLSGRGQGRMVVVAVPDSPEDLVYLAGDLYDSWRLAEEPSGGAVLVLGLEAHSVGLSLDWTLESAEDFQAVRESVRRAMEAQTEPDGAVRAAARIFSDWMERAATRPERKTAREPEPFAAFHEPHMGVADPDRLLTPELTRKSRQEASSSQLTLVVYDRARHPVEVRALAEHLYTAWKESGWLVVASTGPVDAWVIPPVEFGYQGGYRRGLPKAALAWKAAMGRLGHEPASAATAEAWDKALEEISWLGSYPEPPSQDKYLTEGKSSPGRWNLAAFVLAVGLFVVSKLSLGRLEAGKGPHSLEAFMVCGLLYTVVYGCALGWVLEQNRLIGLFATFFSFPWVFIGVRRFCAYFDFNPFYVHGSGCALAALGLFFSLVAFSSDLFLVGPLVRTVELHELPRAAGGAFHVRGATPRRDYSAKVDVEREGGGLKSAMLAPLVPEGWTPEEPVTVWLICRHDTDYREECAWDEPVTDVIAPTPLGVATTIRALQRAELVTTLRSAPGARLLSRSDDAGAAVRRVLVNGLLVPLFFVAAFVMLARYGSSKDEADSVKRPSQMEANQGWKSKTKARK